MLVFGINGNAMAGKDTFTGMVQESLLKRHENTAVTISTIDPVKEFYKNMGWDGDKYKDIHRKNLNTLKLIWIDACNGPMEWVKAKCTAFQKDRVAIVFVMVREFSEMIKIVEIGKQFSTNSGTIRIVRDGLPVPPVEQEFIDSHPKEYMYDFTIINPTVHRVDGRIPELEKAASSFLHVACFRNTEEKLVWNPTECHYENNPFGFQVY